MGLFIAFIGLKEAGVIVADPATTVAMGDLTKPTAALSILGLLVMGALMAWRVKGAILIGILVAACAAWALGLAKIVPGEYGLAALTATAFKLDVPAALHLNGALGMARDEYEADSASSQFFFLLFDSDLTPAGKNLLDGRYSCFGYTIAGSDFLGAVEEGDIIKSVKILKAPPPFGDYKGLDP